jgi:aldose 1-epimerase
VDGSDRLARHPNLTEPRGPIAPSGEQIELAFGDQRAVVTEVGAGLRSYFADGRALVDGYEPDEFAPSGRGQLLIPWPNRIEDGSYELDGRRHQLPLDEPERQNAIHGLVRWSAWRIAERENDSAVLEHVLHPRPGYPFSLALRVEYSLSDDGLTVRTAAANVGAETAPYGMGAHPYLAVGGGRVDATELGVPAGTVLEANERGIPVGAAPVEGTELDFRIARAIGTTKLDHAFTDLERGSDGRATVELGTRDGETALWVDEAYPYLMVFTGDTLPDGGRRSVAVEPMTCAPNAFRSGDGLIRLEPEQTHTGTWGISPVAGPLV